MLVIAAIAFFWWAGRRAGGHLSRRMLTARIVIALLCWGVFAGRSPLGRYLWLYLWGGKIAQALGVPIAQTEFWSWAGPARALSHSVLADASSVMNIGMLIGASGWAIYTTCFGQAGWPPVGQVMAAIIGGLLMGVGARLGFGCNIGAFLGGIHLAVCMVGSGLSSLCRQPISVYGCSPILDLNRQDSVYQERHKHEAFTISLAKCDLQPTGDRLSGADCK